MHPYSIVYFLLHHYTVLHMEGSANILTIAAGGSAKASQMQKMIKVRHGDVEALLFWRCICVNDTRHLWLLFSCIYATPAVRSQ